MIETSIIHMPSMGFDEGELRVDLVVTENMIGDLTVHVMTVGVCFAVLTAGADWDWYLSNPQEYVEWETVANVLTALGEVTLERFEWYCEEPTRDRFDSIASETDGHEIIRLLGRCARYVHQKYPWLTPEVVGFS